jgi:hypothetical protein
MDPHPEQHFPPQQHCFPDDYWTTVLSDFRRSVSNLVLFMLESIPMPWIFPVPPGQQPQQPQQPQPFPDPEGTVTTAYPELEEWFLDPLPCRQAATAMAKEAADSSTQAHQTPTKRAPRKKPSAAATAAAAAAATSGTQAFTAKTETLV